ncbi:hypothetical protein EPVG_00321 [Emiliania huxleyi virus 201]|nr:hypothetical protein ELVG_00303 [Emiliania huxleyi virus 203]AEP15775.1 hypothetical protein EQVG_00366 [Emiliania huxleyi virus 207]AEP16168.1 hypothetical protein ERVG_00293 [Emiliania huxleyi virus 208]AET98208.1 hypothetical protein EPVG_00321 [Emiliania huxleyi virus 201]
MFVHSWQSMRVRNFRSVPQMHHSRTLTRATCNHLRTRGQRILYAMRQRVQSEWGAIIKGDDTLTSWARDTELTFRVDLLDDFIYYGQSEDLLRKQYTEMLAFIHVSLQDMVAQRTN